MIFSFENLDGIFQLKATVFLLKGVLFDRLLFLPFGCLGLFWVSHLLAPAEPRFLRLLLTLFFDFFFFLELPFSSRILIWLGTFPKFFMIILIGKSIVSCELFLYRCKCVGILSVKVISDQVDVLVIILVLGSLGHASVADTPF